MIGGQEEAFVHGFGNKFIKLPTPLVIQLFDARPHFGQNAIYTMEPTMY
jgi:hypothetical protein